MKNETNIENVENTENKIADENKQTEEEKKAQKKEKKLKRKKAFRIVFNAITFILFIVVVLDVIIGVINMQKINNKEEPVWYLSTKTTETELKTVTEYHLGLYKIVITDTAKETKTTLKPFFLSE